MLDITPLKILIILVVALVVLGPDRLPRLARQVASAWGDLQRFRRQMSSEVRETVLGERPPQSRGAASSDPGPPAHHHHTGSGATGSNAEVPDPLPPGCN